MGKRLPYFQFEPGEYLAGDIMFCSYGAQGIFNSICSLYWQKECDLSYSQIVKRLGNEDLISELIKENIIKIENDTIIINFLDEQYVKATEKSKTNSVNGSKGALKRWQKNSEIDSQAIATPLIGYSESIALREDKIKEDKIKEDNISIPSFSEFSAYAKEKEPKVNIKALKNKYDAWVVNGWKNGNDKPIKNWKSMLLQTLIYIHKDITNNNGMVY